MTADDLGLHEDINRGIFQAHTVGIVTSASVVTCGEAFEDAMRARDECPRLDLGVHLTLIEERPLSAARDIPTLVGADGRFLPSYRHLAARVLRGMVSPHDVRRELRRQVERLLDSGAQPSHLDGHQHVHVLPSIWKITAELARDYGVRWVRTPRFTSLFGYRKSHFDPVFRLGLNILSGRAAASRRGRGPVVSTPGLHLTGRLGEVALARVVATLPSGLSEIVTHPGVTTPALRARYRWNCDWSAELAALTSPRISSLLRANGVTLTRFSES